MKSGIPRPGCPARPFRDRIAAGTEAKARLPLSPIAHARTVTAQPRATATTTRWTARDAAIHTIPIFATTFQPFKYTCKRPSQSTLSRRGRLGCCRRKRPRGILRRSPASTSGIDASSHPRTISSNPSTPPTRPTKDKAELCTRHSPAPNHDTPQYSTRYVGISVQS